MIRYVSAGILIIFLIQELAICSVITVGENESIQTAINDANSGDIVVVNSGTYFETIDVNRSITLQGVGMPVVDGQGRDRIVTLLSGDCSISGFVIMNSSKSSHDTGCVVIESNNNSLRNNIIENCSCGISLLKCSNNTIENNHFSFSKIGVSLDKCTENNIINNSFKLINKYSIYTLNSSFNVIDSNSATNCKYGIYLDSSDNNTISKNNLSLGDSDGLNLISSKGNYIIENNVSSYKYNGIYLKNCINTYISKNLVFNNSNYGIYILDSIKDIISENIILYNKWDGIRVSNCRGIYFEANNISKNENSGIYFSKGNNYTFANNTALSNIGVGIFLKNLEKGVIMDNNASDNQAGMLLLESHGNSIERNNVISNVKNGLFIEKSNYNTIINNNAGSSLGGFVLFESYNNNFINNSAFYSSAAFALQDSSDNSFSRNNITFNKIGIYLNRSNRSQFEENYINNNTVGVALNFSDISPNKENITRKNKYDLLSNNNKTISKYRIWKETIISEDIEDFLATYEKVIYGIPDRSMVRRLESARTRPKEANALNSREKEPTGSLKLPVMIESNPSGAEVWIDGKPIGNLTPCKVFLEIGNREIELFLSRYESFKEKYYVAGPTFIIAELRTLRDDSSNDGDFSANIDSIPNGASIWIDGNFTGKMTPYVMHFSGPGNHTYELFSSGYEPFKGEINLKGPGNIQAKLIAEKSEGENMPSKGSSRMPAIPIWCSILSIALARYLVISRDHRFR